MWVHQRDLGQAADYDRVLRVIVGAGGAGAQLARGVIVPGGDRAVCARGDRVAAAGRDSRDPSRAPTAPRVVLCVSEPPPRSPALLSSQATTPVVTCAETAGRPPIAVPAAGRTRGTVKLVMISGGHRTPRAWPVMARTPAGCQGLQVRARLGCFIAVSFLSCRRPGEPLPACMFRRSAARAADSRDLMVPAGMFRSAAIWPMLRSRR